MTTIAIGSDHRGFNLKQALIEYLESKKYKIIDCGTVNETEKVDYPDFAKKVASEVINGATGILICHTGIGMSIAANRKPCIRAALCASPDQATLAREHNDANILVLGAGFISQKKAITALDNFLNTKCLGERHQIRVRKIDSDS